MNMIGKSTAICAGAVGLAFVGYCIYFDRKRRSDPEYKAKIRERRKKEKTSTQNTSTGGQRPRPDATDTQAVQNYFLQEIHTGEEKLALGMIDAGVEHLYNAVSICAQPQQLLQVLQQTLPPNIFQQLINKLQSVATSKVSKEPIAEQVDDELE